MRKHLLVSAALLTLCGCAGKPATDSPTPSRDNPIAVSTASSPAPATPIPSSQAPSLQINKTRREDVPVKLTASDGTGLELVSYRAQAVVNGPLAFTELHLTFRNPQPRVLEGHFEIVLPEKAALSRLAMKNAQGWQEAEVVELQKARQAYEDFLHRRQDPALMEKQAGNQFQARVFPIPANGEKELILSYSQELTSEQSYVLPLAGLPKVAQLNVDASVWVGPDRPSTKLHYSLKEEAPAGDLQILRASPTKGLMDGEITLLSVTPQAKDSQMELQDMLVLIDTSASRAAGYRAELHKTQEILLELAKSKPKARVKIAAFDQEVVPIYEGPLEGCQDAFRKLEARRPLGATDMVAALHWADRQKGYKRLILVTDGVTTAGAAELPKLASVARVDAVLVGGIREAGPLQELVFHDQAKSGLVLDGEKSASELSRSLLRQPLSGLAVKVEGADWVWPPKLDGVEPGQERLIYAQLKKPGQAAKVTVGEQTLSIPLTSVDWPILRRAAASAQIARLLGERGKAEPKEKEKLGRQIVELSTRNRVVCDLTALLVLETNSDYERFGINRDALTDIMIVGQDGGIQMEQRKRPYLAQAELVETAQGGKLEKSALASSTPVAGVSARGGEEDGAVPLGRQANAESFDRRPAGAPRALSRDSVAVTYDRNSAPASARAEAGGAPAPLSAREESAQPLVNDSNAAGSVSSARIAPPTNGVLGLDPRSDTLASSPRPSVVAQAPRRGFARPSSYSRVYGRRQQMPEQGQFEANGAPALTGKLLEIDSDVKAGKFKEALKAAEDWQAKEPGDVLALVALGESYDAAGNKLEAARAYGSIIDLYPGRADLRRFAGSRLEVLGATGEPLAADTFAKALEQRPDHPSSYRMRAYALVRLGKLSEAFDVLEKGAKQPYPPGRFLGCDQILREDLALVGAAWAAQDPKQRPEIAKRITAAGSRWEDAPSTRFVLSWETDANDVDFHIRDSQGGHAFYSQPNLPSGGSLYADVTTGYGPECFNIPGKPSAGPYKIFIHYYSRGPMGYGMGKVEIVRHDGQGHLKFEERPYIVMNDQAYVDLGMVKL